MTSSPFVQLSVWPQAMLSALVKVSGEYQPSEPADAEDGAVTAEPDEDPHSLPSLLERRKLTPRATCELKTIGFLDSMILTTTSSTPAVIQMEGPRSSATPT